MGVHTFPKGICPKVNWSLNSRATISQTIALTITPRGHPCWLLYNIKISISNKWISYDILGHNFSKILIKYAKLCSYWASQKFCNILVTWGTIQQLHLLWWSHESDSVMQSLPDSQFSTILGLPNLAWLTRFLFYCDQLYIYFLHDKCFWLLPWCYGSVWICKA